MFVVSLIGRGRLQQTDIKHDPNSALKLAQQWMKESKDEYGSDGYIAIDSHTKEGTFRYMEIRFDMPEDEVKMFVHQNSGTRVFSASWKTTTWNFFISFLEFSLIQLGEFLKNRK